MSEREICPSAVVLTDVFAVEKRDVDGSTSKKSCASSRPTLSIGRDRSIGVASGEPEDKSTAGWHKFATAAIVGENTHFTVGVQPLGSVEYAGNTAYPGDTDQSYHCGDVVRRLINRATEYVDIRTVYADREFYAADVIYALENAGVQYVIPAPKRARLKRKVGNFDTIKRGFEDDDRDVQMHVHEDYQFTGRSKGK